MRRCVLMRALLVISITPASPVLAQDVSLVGYVTDAQGAVIPDADVRLARENGTIARERRSGGQGEYRIDGLPAGVFIVDITKPGFRRHTQVVTLMTNELITLKTELAVAGVDDSVVVTAVGAPQVTQETSKPITIVSAQEIQARNEVALAEIVRFTAGVQIRNSGGPGQTTSMRIRGLRPDASAVLIDGLRFRDASTTQGDVTSFLQTLNFIAADRVEVLRGSGSSLYGTNAVGGVVNIVTRPGGGSVKSDAQIEGGSLGQFRARATVGGGAAAGRLNYSAGVLQYNVLDGFDGNDETRSTGGQGQIHYHVSSTSSLSFRAFGSDDDVQLNVSPTTTGVPAGNIPSSTIVDAIPVAPDEIERANQGLPFQVGNATFIPARDDPDNQRTSASYSTALVFRHSGWSAVSWQTSYQRVHTSRTFANGPLGAAFQPAALNYSNYVGTIDTVDVRAFMTPAPWLSVTGGYEFERERYFDQQDNNLPDPLRTRTETRIQQDAHAGFASAQIAALDRRLQLSISGRVQGFSVKNPELRALGTTSPYDGVAVPAPPRALTGDVSAAYFVAASNTKLRVHGGNAYRAPALYERFGGGFSTDPVTGLVLFTAYGDPRLEPDRYRAIDAGVDQYLFGSRLLVSATAFYTDVISLTAFDTAGGIRPDTDPYGRALGYLNGSGGFSRGFELGLEARPSRTLRLSGSYTYTRAETNDDITIPDFFRVPGVFGHTATLVATNRWGARLDTTFDLFYGSSQYTAFSAAGRPRAYKFPGFVKAAVVAGYRIVNRERWPFRVYLKVDNLLDDTYYEGGWQNLGRTIVAGASLGF
jgi:vitamin B12 transporter